MKSLKILIVEDDPLFLITLEWALDKMAHQILGVVDNADDALQELQANQPDLILMDVSIKGNLNGIELARLIRRNYPTPIIFLTAFADLTLHQQVGTIDATDFLVKPFEMPALRQAVDRVLGR